MFCFPKSSGDGWPIMWKRRDSLETLPKHTLRKSVWATITENIANVVMCGCGVGGWLWEC